MPRMVSSQCSPTNRLPFLSYSGSGGIASDTIIPSDRKTLWQPGVTYNVMPAVIDGQTTDTTGLKGIRNRTTIFTTLNPLGTATATITAGTPVTISLPGGSPAIGTKFTLTTTGVMPRGVAPAVLLTVASTGWSSSSFAFYDRNGSNSSLINSSDPTQSGTHT